MIIIGEITMERTTDNNGYAYFNLSERLLGSDITIKITLEGFLPAEYSTIIAMDGMLMEVPPMLEEIMVEEDRYLGDSLIILIVSFLIVLSILSLLIFGRRKEEYGDEE